MRIYKAKLKEPKFEIKVLKEGKDFYAELWISFFKTWIRFIFN